MRCSHRNHSYPLFHLLRCTSPTLSRRTASSLSFHTLAHRQDYTYTYNFIPQRLPKSHQRTTLRHYATCTSGRTRRATKAALALRQLILDPPSLVPSQPASIHRSSPKTTLSRVSGRDGSSSHAIAQAGRCGSRHAEARTLPRGKNPTGQCVSIAGNSGPRR